MQMMIFVNLPVKDLDLSIRFYVDLGFEKIPEFSDHTAACIKISDSIFIMALTYEKYQSFTRKSIADATKTSEVINALTVQSREEVDAYFKRAVEAGGSEAFDTQDYGFMYSKSFNDPDGHIWEVFWMDPKQQNA